MFLLIIALVAATASAALCSDLSTARLQDSQFCFRDSQRDSAATQHAYKVWPNRLLALAAQKIPSKVIADYIPDDKPTLLFGRRASMHQSAKRFWNTGHVSAGVALQKPSAKPLHCLIFTSTPTVVSISKVPLNRGPTSSV